jgi:hypothetical protein
MQFSKNKPLLANHFLEAARKLGRPGSTGPRRRCQRRGKNLVSNPTRPQRPANREFVTIGRQQQPHKPAKLGSGKSYAIPAWEAPNGSSPR